jgi:hypothetical protein
MSMPLSVALQLALACMPAILLAVLAGQITQPAPVDPAAALSATYKPTFSDASISQAEKRTPGEDQRNERIAVASMSAIADHPGGSVSVFGTKTATAADLIPAKALVLQGNQDHVTVKINYASIPGLGWLRTTMPFRPNQPC